VHQVDPTDFCVTPAPAKIIAQIMFLLSTPQMKYGKYWFHLQNIFFLLLIFTFKDFSYLKKSDALVGRV
jgi:hypothetical protein